MNAHDDRFREREPARSMIPEVDAAIERLVSSMPLRRPSAALDARVRALLERPSQPWWQRIVPLAAAAVLLLGIGFVAGAWISQVRLGVGNALGVGNSTSANSTGDLQLVLQDTSATPAAWGTSRTLDLGDDGAVQAAPSVWIRTDRFHDPERGVTIERSYPETWTLVGSPSAD